METKNDEIQSSESEFSFEDQLCWCMGHLEEKLQAERVSPREAQSLLKSLKILKNSKTPYIKKRQVMRLTCGDYRKTMAEELKVLKKQMKNSELECVKEAYCARVLRVVNSSSKESEEIMDLPAFQFNFPKPENGLDILN